MTDKLVRAEDVERVLHELRLGYEDNVPDAASALAHAHLAIMNLPPAPAGEGEGWQPIETAPRDGTRLILSDGTKSWVGYWLDNSHTQWPWAGWRVPSMEPEPRTKPTLWHPLLVPPTRAALSQTGGKD